MKILDNSDVRHIFEIFSRERQSIRLVGGCVRDSFLGLEPSDIDFCTTALPDDVERICRKYGLKFVATGISHGTITIINNSGAFEVTTLRKDTKPDGRWSEVIFTDSFQEDSNRRDFTFNALSVDFSGTIYDYHGGLTDLEDHNIRFIGDTDTRIKEDYLRILRYFRFVAKYNLIMNRKDLDVIKANIDGLRKLSTERVWSELKKIFSSLNARSVITEMYELGIFGVLGIDMNISKLSLFRNPIMSIASCVSTGPRSFQFIFKLSNAEFKELNFYRKYSDSDYDKLILLLNSGAKPEWVYNLNQINSICDQGVLEAYTPKIFPITGEDLLSEGFTTGKPLGDKLNELRLKWIDSGFSSSKDDLLG